MQDLKAVFVLIAEALAGQDREDLLGTTCPRARSIRPSGIFGRPSGNRSNGFCAVNSISCSLVSVNSCACVTAGSAS